mgnify:CR=1 FL=1
MLRLLPSMEKVDIINYMIDRQMNFSSYKAENLLSGALHNSIARTVLRRAGISPEDRLWALSEEAVERLSGEDAVSMLEINVSCPNVKEGAIAFGQKPGALEEITKEIVAHAGKPVIMKLSPNVTDIAEMARVAESAGADAISLINTITGMKIDVEKRRFALANKTGGMSGPAIKPVAVRMVYQAAHAVKIPVIGMGGIANANDALEFIMAGAKAVAVGAMNFADPYTTEKVVDGIEEYMHRHNIEDINELIGVVQ